MYEHERSLVKRLQDKPFALVGVNSDKDANDVKKVLEKEKITWRSFWNGPQGLLGPISTAWGVHGWPTLFLIDHKGVIRHKWLGNPGDSTLDKSIDELLKELSSDKAES